ncbi:MAG TPA: glycosyltransferase family 4 protein [Rhizomicrobium sp.]|jgi:glycosyltransferase involved in cell wall biosynthesis|nr:glycosyltransferase family 4 protein [Rhizomicrobium sp.]
MNAHAPKRILVSTDAVGGVWVYALELIGARKPAFEIELAVLGPAPEPAQMKAAHAAGANVHVTELPLDWTAVSPDELAHASQVLAMLARRLEIDFVQLHTPALVGTALWPVPVLAVLHSCVGTWWHGLHGQLPPPEDFLWRMAAVQTGLEAADAIIAPTHALSEAARAVYGTQRPIHVVHNTRRPAAVSRASQTAGILAVGRLWDAAKNIALLDHAAALIGGIPVLAAGPTSGPNGAGISLKAIQWLGALTPEDLVPVLASVRIFAAPALYEPFGLAVLEAAQAGLPLVLADIPTFRELWDGAALFLPPENPEIWASVLAALHDRPDVCRDQGMKAHAHAAKYGSEHFARAMREIYHRLFQASDHATAA